MPLVILGHYHEQPFLIINIYKDHKENPGLPLLELLDIIKKTSPFPSESGFLPIAK